MLINDPSSTIGVVAVILLVGCSTPPPNSEGTIGSRLTDTVVSDATFRDAVACTDCVVYRAKLNLPETGVQAWHGKVWNDSARNYEIAIRDDGSIADPDQLMAQERAAYLGRYGKLRRELYERRTALSSEDRIDIAIWASVPFEQSDRVLLASSPDAARAFSQKVQANIKSASAPIYSALAAKGGTHLDGGSGSPLILATVPSSAIDYLVTLPEVASVGLATPGRLASTAWYGAIFASNAHVLSTGIGESICNNEPAQPSSYAQLSILGQSCANPPTSDHFRWTSGILKTTDAPVDSVANGSDLYLGEWNCDGINYVGADTWCLAQGARHVSLSYGWSESPGGSASTDWHQDWMALQWPYPLYVAAAGNDAVYPSAYIVANRNYNGLVVGGIDDKGTTTTADDVFMTTPTTTAWGNPTTAHNDYELPQIAAPAANITVLGQTRSGSSGATPMVAGTGALVAGADPVTFHNWPEMTKAVLLAASVGRADQSILSTLPAGSDQKIGAGQLNSYNAVFLATPSYYNALNSPYGRFASSVSFVSDFDGAGYWTHTFHTNALYAARLRAVLVWDATPAGCNANGIGCTGSTPDADLDLRVCDNSTGACTASSTFDSTWEIVDLVVVSGHSYTIKVKKWSTATSGTYVGLAWMQY
jgi:hypothetical protein